MLIRSPPFGGASAGLGTLESLHRGLSQLLSFYDARQDGAADFGFGHPTKMVSKPELLRKF